MSPAPMGARLAKLAAILLFGAFAGGLFWGLGYLFDAPWLQVTGYGVGGFLAAIGLFTAVTAKVADCPCCGQRLAAGAFDTLSASDENEQIECGNCFEWLVSHEGRVRGFTEQDAAARTSFAAPVFEGGGWANECVTCGAPPERVEEAKKVKLEASQLLVGILSVASASVQGIPYCREHGAAVSVTVEDEHPRLVFTNYAARRRYVAVNRGRMAAKLKG